ncbi:MAG TPA: MFS transporter [Solirubrobacteraceae bacterium]|jgi:MFS family permease|nr:MFS transporter [Solirubrobacteraceae bacterium]
MRRQRPLSNRDFLLLWSGEALSEVGSQTSTVAYPLLVLALTGSPVKAGVVGLAKWLPLAIFSLPAGVLADRFDRKRLMIGCDVIRMMGAASIVVALVLGHPAYAQVVGVAFLDGGLFITSYICERGALRHVVPPEQLQDAVATNEARSFAAGIVGPSLGGLLFSVTRALPFAADTVSFLCSTAAIAGTRSRFQTAAEAQARPWRQMRAEVAEGFTWLRGQPFYRTTALLFAAGNPIFTGLYLLAILLARHHHASTAMIGVMLTIIGVCGLLGAVIAGPLRRRAGARGLIVGEPWLALGVVLLMLIAHNPLLIGVLVGATEFVTPATNAVVAGSRIAAAPDHLQGRVQAVATTMSMSLAWLGPLSVGYLFEHGGPATTILAVAVWTLGLALCATAAPSIRHPPTLVQKRAGS